MIFVTGGTGLVGAHLLFELTSAGKKVKALKRQTSNLLRVLRTFSYYSENSQDLFNQIEWVDGDILDHFSFEKYLNGVTEIYHCAAIVSFEKKERKRIILSALLLSGLRASACARIWPVPGKEQNRNSEEQKGPEGSAIQALPSDFR